MLGEHSLVEALIQLLVERIMQGELTHQFRLSRMCQRTMYESGC